MSDVKGPSKGLRKSVLAYSTFLAGIAAAVAVGNGVSYAQDSESGETVVVTGSRIPQPNLYTTSPVTQVTAEDIAAQGVTRLEDMTNELPQIFAAQGSNVSNGASGTATVNLRGLGSQRTLVLVNGRRMPYGSPGGSSADLNQIPGAMVDRVDVLTGGASAVYGSDALAGVVNFIMKDDFEGFRVDGQYGYNQHNNNSDDGYIREVIAARGANNPSQFQLPPDNVDDGYGKELTFLLGVSSPDGKGNVTAYLGYRNNSAILQRDRDYSACAIANPSVAAVAGVPAGAVHWTCGGSATSFPGYYYFAGAGHTIDFGTGTFIPFTANNQYNFGPLNYYQRPDERYTGGAFAHYTINEHAEVYTELMFSDYKTDAQIAPSGDFFGTNTINCDNPLLTPSMATDICGADAGTPTVASLYIARRNVEGGGRDDNREFQTYRMVSGIRGAINDVWSYDVSGTFSHVSLSQVYRNDFSNLRLGRALNVVDVGGTPTCQSVVDGTDPACVPWDIFNNNVSQAALNYLQIPLVAIGSTEQQDVIASVTGSAPMIKSPGAEDGLSIVFGAEYRRDSLEFQPDTSFQSGDGAGQGGPTLPLTGAVEVHEFFTEGRLPIIQNGPFAELLQIDAAYRYSDYSTGNTTDTYKFGAEWAPTEDIRFRGAFQHAVRAANIIELFAAQGAGLFNLGFDPCDNTRNGGTTPAQCIGANPWQVTLAQSQAGGLNNPAGQYNGLFGGNPNLAPEEADTTTLGVVFTPSFLPGFNVTVDHFDIDVTNLIAATGSGVLSACYNNNDLSACNLINRNPNNGRLFGGNANFRVVALNTNLGGLSTAGYDINANYKFDIGDMGSISMQMVGTFLEKLITDEGGTRNPYDCAGLWSGDANCGTPSPEWRHRFRASWETPWDLELSLTWRYYSEVHREQNVGGQGGFEADPTTPVANQLGTILDAQNYFDIAGNYQMFENTNIRFGVDNVLDKDPPLSTNTHVGAGFGNGNTFPQVYDATGRWIFIGATVDF